MHDGGGGFAINSAWGIYDGRGGSLLFCVMGGPGGGGVFAILRDGRGGGSLLFCMMGPRVFEYLEIRGSSPLR